MEAETKLIENLEPGDIVVAVPQSVKPRFSVEGVAHWLIHKTTSATHVMMYTGDSQLVDITFDPPRTNKIRQVHVSKVLERYEKVYGHFKLHVVHPKEYSEENRKNAIDQLSFYVEQNLVYSLRHLARFAWWIWRTPERLYTVIEPPALKGFAVCSTLIARVLKESGIDIGQRASITFTPKTFLTSSKFVKKKVVRV